MSQAVDHVDWYLASIRPLLIDFYEHGKKHGREEAQNTPVEVKSLREAYRSMGYVLRTGVGWVKEAGP